MHNLSKIEIYITRGNIVGFRQKSVKPVCFELVYKGVELVYSKAMFFFGRKKVCNLQVPWISFCWSNTLENISKEKQNKKLIYIQVPS